MSSRGSLETSWGYSDEVHRRETVEHVAQCFADSLRRLVAYCEAPGPVEYVPRIFRWHRSARMKWTRSFEITEKSRISIPVSPMQAGILFHTLFHQDAGMYVGAGQLSMQGAVDSLALRNSWRAVIEHHPVLRTSFVIGRSPQQLQIVHRDVVPEWVEADWRAEGPTVQSERLQQFLAEDRARNFRPGQAPLTRFALFRLADDLFQFVWTHHHVLLDGWSVSLVIKETLVYYEAFLRGIELRPVSTRPYRDYIEWLQGRDFAQAERVSAAALGFREPSNPEFKPVSSQPTKNYIFMVVQATGHWRKRYVRSPVSIR